MSDTFYQNLICVNSSNDKCVELRNSKIESNSIENALINRLQKYKVTKQNTFDTVVKTAF